jgi:aromatic ring-opening dioxygenase catalytic subunit (LigB family)
MLIKRLLTCAAILSISIAAKASDEVEVAGRVIDADTKKPIKEVVITALHTVTKEQSIVTLTGGTYAFGELKPGTYKITFQAEGYKKIVKEKIVVKPNSTVLMNVEMMADDDIEHGLLYRALMDN